MFFALSAHETIVAVGRGTPFGHFQPFAVFVMRSFERLHRAVLLTVTDRNAMDAVAGPLYL